MEITLFPTWTSFLPKQFTLSIMKRLIVYERLIFPMESFRKRKSVKVLRITHLYEHFCVRCKSCVSVHYLISFYTVTILISETGTMDKYQQGRIWEKFSDNILCRSNAVFKKGGDITSPPSHRHPPFTVRH